MWEHMHGSGPMRSEPGARPRDLMTEVAIIGAGPAGSVAALLLARAGLRPLLLTSSDGSAFQVGEGLPPAARPLLERLGLMERYVAGGHLTSFGNQSAWGSDELVSTDFIFSPYGNGWHLDRAAFNRMLMDAAREAGAIVDVGVRFGRAERSDAGWRLFVERPEGAAVVTAGFVLDCSGRRALFASSIGVKREHIDRLVANVALMEAEREGDCDATTTIESVPGGWWYTALLPGGRRVMIVLGDGDLIDPMQARSSVAWLAGLGRTRHMRAIAERFAYRIVGEPWLTAAGSSRLLRFGGDCWLAAGDAAASFDPLSSQGIVTAMAAGSLAAETVLAHLDGDASAIGSYSSSIERIYDEYLRNRVYYYTSERRWPESEFWRRRTLQGASSSV